MISSRVPRLVTVAVTIALVQPLAGCFLPNDIIPAAILIPPAYRAAPRHAVTARVDCRRESLPMAPRGRIAGERGDG